MESLSKEKINLLSPSDINSGYTRAFTYGPNILGSISTRPSVIIEPFAIVRIFDKQNENSSLEFRADTSSELINSIDDDNAVRELIGGAIVAHNSR